MEDFGGGIVFCLKFTTLYSWTRLQWKDSDGYAHPQDWELRDRIQLIRWCAPNRWLAPSPLFPAANSTLSSYVTIKKLAYLWYSARATIPFLERVWKGKGWSGLGGWGEAWDQHFSVRRKVRWDVFVGGKTACYWHWPLVQVDRPLAMEPLGFLRCRHIKMLWTVGCSNCWQICLLLQIENWDADQSKGEGGRGGGGRGAVGKGGRPCGV